MTLRVKIVFILLIAVGVLLIVLTAFSIVRYFQGRTEPTTGVEEPLSQDVSQGESPVTTQSSPLFQQPTPPAPAAEPGDEIIALVVPFVERFGSYSNQGNFENLSDLLPFMSGSMRAWAEKQIKEQTAKPFQELYRGVTTKALSYTVTRYEPEKGSAEMRVSTQRRELIGSTVNARVYNQDVVVALVRDDGAWVVDSAFWK